MVFFHWHWHRFFCKWYFSRMSQRFLIMSYDYSLSTRTLLTRIFLWVLRITQRVTTLSQSLVRTANELLYLLRMEKRLVTSKKQQIAQLMTLLSETNICSFWEERKDKRESFENCLYRDLSLKWKHKIVVRVDSCLEHVLNTFSAKRIFILEKYFIILFSMTWTFSIRRGEWWEEMWNIWN